MKQIIDAVVDAPEAAGGSVISTLAGVIEDHVEDDLDSRLVQGQHHGLELIDVPGTVSGIAGFQGEKRGGVVAPEIFKRFPARRIPEYVVIFIKFGDRHELNGRNAQFLQVRDFLHDSMVGPGMGYLRAWVTGETADMHLIDDGFGQGDVQRLIVLPVEIVFDDCASGSIPVLNFFPPGPGNVSMAYGIKEQDLFVIHQAVFCP